MKPIFKIHSKCNEFIYLIIQVVQQVEIPVNPNFKIC